MTQPATPELLDRIDAWWRAANYLAVGQIYLWASPLLREPLQLEHVKPTLVGHWGTTPGLSFMAAASILRERLPKLRMRLVNVVDLMRLQPDTEHPHGLSDPDYDALFTSDKPIIFAFHGYPWLPHRLAYRRSNHDLHVRGYKEEGTVTAAFDMRVQNDLDRFHLVQDVVYRVSLAPAVRASMTRWVHDKLIEHGLYIREHGLDLPEVRDRTWSPR